MTEEKKQITIDEDKLKEATVTKIGGTNAISFAYKECFEMKLKDRPEVGQKIKFIEPD